MIPFHNIDPIIVSFKLPAVGMLSVSWYGVMYVIGFVLGTYLLKFRVRRGLFHVSEEECSNLITYLIFSILIVARLFYVFVYNWDYYSQNLSQIFNVTKGGLSFHGAIIGFCLAAWYFARRNKVSFQHVTDAMCFAGPQGIFWGRLGNFINGELWGSPSNVPWAMPFPKAPTPEPRHPSQIYEALGEGLLLFGVIWMYQRWALKRGRYKEGSLGALFLVGYGVVRFFIEYIREPDAQLGYIGGILTMGQILCLLMVLAGTLYYWLFVVDREPVQAQETED